MSSAFHKVLWTNAPSLLLNFFKILRTKNYKNDRFILMTNFLEQHCAQYIY